MSEMPYDDHLDINPELNVRDLFRILKRALAYIWPVRGLFVLKFFLMLGSLAPLLIAPWPLKILIDHVVLGRSLAESSIRFPPFIQPFIDATMQLET